MNIFLPTMWHTDVNFVVDLNDPSSWEAKIRCPFPSRSLTILFHSALRFEEVAPFMFYPAILLRFSQSHPSHLSRKSSRGSVPLKATIIIGFDSRLFGEIPWKRSNFIQYSERCCFLDILEVNRQLGVLVVVSLLLQQMQRRKRIH